MALNVSIDRVRVVKTFTTLAEIPSPLLQVAAVMKYLELLLRGWNIAYRFDQAGSSLPGFQCGNLISDVIPATPGYEALPTKGVEAHVDTVALPGTKTVSVVVENDVIRSDGRTILGADDKAGVAAIIAAMSHILTNKLPHGPIQIFFTVGEERSMYGVRELDLGLVKATSVVCVDGLEVNRIWRGCPAKLKYRATFHGSSGHAAMPEQTLNAGLIAVWAVSEALTARLLGDYRDWGIQRGDSLEKTLFHNVSSVATKPPAEFPATNVVPGEATVCGEFRCFSKERLEKSLATLCRSFEAAASLGHSNDGRHKGRVSIETEYPYEPFTLPQEHPLVQNLELAMTAAGVADATSELGPGSTHANVLNQRGIPAVVLGAGGRNPHQNSEYVIIDEMAKAAEILVHYLTAT